MVSPSKGAAPAFADVLGIDPAQTACPVTIEEVMETVAWADSNSQSIVPWGGATGQTYGYAPRRADILLDLSRLNRVVAHEPGDLIVTVEAGATLLAVQDALARHNQFLPLDPSHPSQATIGGILAANAFGASRTRFGTARDWLIGLKVVDARGRLIKGGGKVVKNVTGYDLPKLHIGALGTLGVIVEATFKVAPRPETSRALLFQLSAAGEPAGKGIEGMAKTIGRLVSETAPALGLIRDSGGTRIAAFLYTGTAEVVESQRDLAIRLAAAASADFTSIGAMPGGMGRAFTEETAPAGSELILHVSGPPASELARHDAFAHRFAPCLLRLDTYPGSGHSRIALGSGGSGDDITQTAQDCVTWALDFGARIAFLDAPLALRQPAGLFPLWSPLPPSLSIMRRLKAALDPNDTLNPGRFIEGI